MYARLSDETFLVFTASLSSVLLPTNSLSSWTTYLIFLIFVQGAGLLWSVVLCYGVLSCTLRVLRHDVVCCRVVWWCPVACCSMMCPAVAWLALVFYGALVCESLRTDGHRTDDDDGRTGDGTDGETENGRRRRGGRWNRRTDRGRKTTTGRAM